MENEESTPQCDEEMKGKGKKGRKEGRRDAKNKEWGRESRDCS